MLKINDADNFRRTLAGLGLILGSLALFVGDVIQPALRESSAEALRVTAEYPGRVLATALLFFVSAVLLVPGILGIVHLLRDRATVLGHVGGALSIVGVMFFAIIHARHAFLIGMVESGTDREQMVALSDRVMAGPIFSLIYIILLLGFVIGPVVLMAGVLRARVAPRWAAVLVIAANVASFVIVNDAALAGLNGLFALGLTAIGLKMLSMSDEEWRQEGTSDADRVAARVQPQVQ